MNHNLTKININGSNWLQCDDCGCTFCDQHWWVDGMKSKIEPKCSADNLDWERNAIKEVFAWN